MNPPETLEETKVDVGAPTSLDLPLGVPSFGDPVEHDRLYEVLFRSAAPVRTLGRYHIINTLGEGGMGVVLEAFDPMLDRPVAIKALHRYLGQRHTQRLVREAQAMACLRHPHVVQVYEVGEAEGQTFIAMELVRGQSLRDWQRAEPPPDWRACVRAYCQAGRGLAAAHAQGLVHRDFKPGNAVIEDGGRVQVLDFGLARRAEDRSSSDDDLISQELSASVSFDVPLTQTGTVLGTPGYMSPEQIKGEPVDGRSDQFSFCVSLYEALYGQRPFAGRSMAVLHVAIKGAKFEPVPRKHGVPARLRRVLVRGLAADPQQRWPSMEALIAELERLLSPSLRRFRALGLITTVAVGGLSLAQLAEVGVRCEGASRQLVGVWDPERRQDVEHALLGTGLSYAPETWARVAPRLDEYADDWAADSAEVCEATRAQQPSDAVMDLRVRCLDDRRQALGEVVGLLAEANASRVEAAVELVSGLPPLSGCDDPDALAQAVRLPSGAEARAEARAMRGVLARARVLRGAGEYDEGLELTKQVVAGAQALDDPSLLAEATLERGRANAAQARYEVAVRDLDRAYLLALEHRHEDVMLAAATELTVVMGHQIARYASARQWGNSAMALARRRVHEPMAQARVRAALGTLASSQGRYDEALEHQREALGLVISARGPADHAVAVTLQEVATTMLAQGGQREALPLLRRALGIFERALGPSHPTVGRVQGDLASGLISQAEHEEAMMYLGRSLEVCERAFGLVHPSCARVLESMGTVQRERGVLDRSLAHHRRAAAIFEHALGPEHPELARSEHSIGVTLRMQGKREDGLFHMQRALSILERTHGPEHPDAGMVLSSMTKTLVDLGRWEQALSHGQRALAIEERTLPPDHPRIASSLIELGHLLAQLGRFDEALVHMQRSLGLMEGALGPDDRALATPLTTIGRLLRQRGQPDEARACVLRAVALVERGGDPRDPELARPLVELSRLALADGLRGQSAAFAERAVQLSEQGSERGRATPLLVAVAQAQLARALIDEPSLRARALTLAEQARATLANVGPSGQEERSVLEAWLAAR